MQLRPEQRIRTAIEAMTHVVIPAIDPGDSLAQEQAQLVVGMMTTALDFMPLEFAYDRLELTELVQAAQTLAADTGAADLSDAAGRGSDLLARAGADHREVLDGVRDLRAALSAAVDSVYSDGSEQQRRVVADTVMQLAEKEVPRTRAAYVGHGFEGPSPTIAPLAEQLSAS